MVLLAQVRVHVPLMVMLVSQVKGDLLHTCFLLLLSSETNQKEPRFCM